MDNSLSTRRTFLFAGVAATVAGNLEAEDSMASCNEFLKAWDAAWAKHDAAAMSMLHTEDAVTVNRYGTVLQGREATAKALTFLHGPSGPFHLSTFPPLQLMIRRSISPDVQIVQAAWQNPVMRPDGTIDPASINDMIVTFVLVKKGSHWLASQVNLVNVVKMNLPFANAGQKE